MQYKGTAVSKGVAIGHVFCYQPFVPTVNTLKIQDNDIEAHEQEYTKAKRKAVGELTAICNILPQEDERAKILAAHIEILEDVVMDEEIYSLIKGEKYDASWAIQEVYEQFIRTLAKSKNPLIRERASDMKDVRTRLLRCLENIPERNLSTLNTPIILVANDLFPSDTATMDHTKVLAIITEVGGATSHTAIIAKSYQIPAVMGIENVMELFSDDEEIIVDAIEGIVIAQATDEEKAHYIKKQEKFQYWLENVSKYLDLEPIMNDGTPIHLSLNIGNASVAELQAAKYVDGVGLFRSEFLYMGKESLPTEEEQYTVYRKVLQEFGERPVILRTLDIGGDKKLESMELPKEDNPFLGNRALRLCFSYPDIFATQIKAALRAAVHGNLWLMFPMVGSMDDIRNAKNVVEKAKKDLEENNIPYGNDVKIGIMIEIPSIALIADIVAKEVDFASIGTNDLCQYLTAVDRLNPAVSSYYQSYHPAMFRTMASVAKAFHKEGKVLSVCGELGGDPLALAVLLGLEIHKVSMGMANIASCKKLIRNLSMDKARKIAQDVCELSTDEEIQTYLKENIPHECL